MSAIEGFPPLAIPPIANMPAPVVAPIQCLASGGSTFWSCGLPEPALGANRQSEGGGYAKYPNAASHPSSIEPVSPLI